jgi:hypothetical protein
MRHLTNAPLLDPKGPIDYGYNYGKGIIISSICLIVCFFMATLGPRGYSTLAVGLFYVKLAALLVAAGRCAILLLGRHRHVCAGVHPALLLTLPILCMSPSPPFSFLFVNPHHAEPTSHTNATVADLFTGPSGRSFRSNFYEHERVNKDLHGSRFQDFLILFSIVFAAFSGMPGEA